MLGLRAKMLVVEAGRECVLWILSGALILESGWGGVSVGGHGDWGRGYGERACAPRGGLR